MDWAEWQQKAEHLTARIANGARTWAQRMAAAAQLQDLAKEAWGAAWTHDLSYLDRVGPVIVWCAECGSSAEVSGGASTVRCVCGSILRRWEGEP